jgi:hypothetical protein
MPPGTVARRLAALSLLVASAAGAGCSSQGLLAIMPGVVNDPSNYTLRQEILAKATPELCGELLARNIPIRLRDEDPGSGRMVPQSCQVRPIANGNLQVDFSARGWAWTNVTKRVGLQATASVEYETDFRLQDGSMWIFFKHRSTVAKKMDLLMIESPVAGGIGSLVPGAQALVAPIAERVLEKELTRGFTVVRDSDGYAQFSLGILPVGQRPTAPFEKRGSRQVLANERIEVHQDQRDLVGPFLIEDDDMALFLTVGVEGAPAVDLLVVSEVVGQPWLETHITQAGPSPPPGPPLAEESVPSGALLRRAVRVPKGRVYVVLDNTATAGPTPPAGVQGDDRAALVTLGIELDDAP